MMRALTDNGSGIMLMDDKGKSYIRPGEISDAGKRDRAGREIPWGGRQSLLLMLLHGKLKNLYIIHWCGGLETGTSRPYRNEDVLKGFNTGGKSVFCVFWLLPSKQFCICIFWIRVYFQPVNYLYHEDKERLKRGKELILPDKIGEDEIGKPDHRQFYEMV